MSYDYGVRVVRFEGRDCGLDLGSADVVVVVKYLPLQVGHVHSVKIDDADGSDSGKCQIDSDRRSKTTGAHNKHFGVQQFALADAANLRHYYVSAISPHLIGC